MRAIGSFIERLRDTLRQPYPPDFELKTNVPFGIGLSVLVVFFALNVSFATETYPITLAFLYSLIFGGACFAIFMLNLLVLPRLFPAFFAEAAWKVYKEIAFALWNFFTIGLGNILIVYLLGLTSITPGLFAIQFYFTFLVGSIPLAIYVLRRHNRMLRQSLQEAMALNQLLEQDTRRETRSKDHVLLQSHTGRSERMAVDHFVYAVSERNYVRVFVEQEQQIKETVIRNTMNGVEELFQAYPFIMRCHRAFIVNTSRVTSVSGNAQGYRLALRGSDDSVPVSRRYTPLFKSFLEGSSV